MVRGQQVLFYFIVLAQRHYSRREDMSLHSDTLSWFQANQSLLFLLNAACLADKQQIQMVWFHRGSNQRHTFRNRGEDVNQNTVDAAMSFWCHLLYIIYFPDAGVIHKKLYFVIFNCIN
jgi:hypothetical protein